MCSLYNNHGSKKLAQNILKERRKENMWTHHEKERWKVRTNIKTKDVLQTADIEFFFLNPSAWYVLVMLKECKVNECQKKLQQLQWKEEGKAKTT